MTADRPRELSARDSIGRRIAQVAPASVLDAVRRAIRAPFLVSEVPCPHCCGRVVAVLVHGTRRLHRPVTGGLGPPLGSSRDRVRIECDGCKTRWETSGRASAAGCTMACRRCPARRPASSAGYAYWCLPSGKLLIGIP